MIRAAVRRAGVLLSLAALIVVASGCRDMGTIKVESLNFTA